MEIEGKLQGTLAMKRFYLNGVKIFDNCPKCDTKNEYDYCIHEPLMNESFAIDWYCSNCKETWSKRIVLKINLEEVID